jgi:hypothetical protein
MKGSVISILVNLMTDCNEPYSYTISSKNDIINKKISMNREGELFTKRAIN